MEEAHDVVIDDEKKDNTKNGNNHPKSNVSAFVIEEMGDDFVKEGMNANAQAFELKKSNGNEQAKFSMWQTSYTLPYSETNALMTPSSEFSLAPSQLKSHNMMKTSLNINIDHYDDDGYVNNSQGDLANDFLPSSLYHKNFTGSSAISMDPLQQSWLAPMNSFRAENSSNPDDSYGYSNYTVRSPSNASSQQQSQYSMRSPTSKLTLKEMQLQSMASADGYIYKIHFKRASRHFVLETHAPRNILPGDYVKVEADRGEDLGAVIAKIPVGEFQEFVPTAGYRGRGFSTGATEKKNVLRLATVDECRQLIEKFEDESRCLECIREKVLIRRLPMSIIDCEYQFDHHKLVFFFTADKRVDFRDLVSDLFSLYKTRIWMQQGMSVCI